MPKNKTKKNEMIEMDYIPSTAMLLQKLNVNDYTLPEFKFELSDETKEALESTLKSIKKIGQIEKIALRIETDSLINPNLAVQPHEFKGSCGAGSTTMYEAPKFSLNEVYHGTNVHFGSGFWPRTSEVEALSFRNFNPSMAELDKLTKPAAQQLTLEYKK